MNFDNIFISLILQLHAAGVGPSSAGPFETRSTPAVAVGTVEDREAQPYTLDSLTIKQNENRYKFLTFKNRA